jgi:hypothetical protein
MLNKQTISTNKVTVWMQLSFENYFHNIHFYNYNYLNAVFKSAKLKIFQFNGGLKFASFLAAKLNN